MRKLASVRRIDAIEPIPGADAIEVATLGGWKTVIKKNAFKAGELTIFVEIDSWVPTALAPFPSKGREPREFNGVKGERLRTVTLRGQLSQGLLIPAMGTFPEGADMTDALGIQKWEAPIPAQLAGDVRGMFPDGIPKIDQQRVQNFTEQEFLSIKDSGQFEVTEKLEGSSCTMFLDKEGEFHVCSRNLDLKFSESNSFWKAAIADNVEQKMKDNALFGFAIQGELFGSGIQGNIYGMSGVDFRVFDVYDANNGEYLNPESRRMLISLLRMKHVPVVDSNFALTSVQELIKMADGKSELGNTLREGLVFKQNDGGSTFKCISNSYLISEKS